MGFAACVPHPFGGGDHLAAMIAVGALAGLVGGRARWWLPGACLGGGMALSGALGMAEVPLPLEEAGIFASVVVLGVALAAWGRLPLGTALPLLLLVGETPRAGVALRVAGAVVAVTAGTGVLLG
jgi:urease accessory protein